MHATYFHALAAALMIEDLTVMAQINPNLMV
jgi:hypothetical protein